MHAQRTPRAFLYSIPNVHSAVFLQFVHNFQPFPRCLLSHCHEASAFGSHFTPMPKHMQRIQCNPVSSECHLLICDGCCADNANLTAERADFSPTMSSRSSQRRPPSTTANPCFRCRLNFQHEKELLYSVVISNRRALAHRY